MKRQLAAFAAAFACLSTVAFAEYPERPVTFVVPFAAGGATDALARAFTDRMSRGSPQAFMVENVAGAGGTVGATKIAKSKPDGYSFLIGHMGYMAAATGLYKELPYDPAKDFEAVARFPDTPLVLICGKENRNTTDIKTFMAYAQANPGKVTIANAGVGSTGHLVAALFASALKADVVHVAYKGNAPALTDIIGGRVDCMFDQSNTALPQVNGGRVVALATTSKDRLPQMPSVPTLSESGLPGFEAATWYGIYAPKGTDKAQLQWMLAQFNAAMADNAFVSKLVEQGYVLLKPEDRGPEALAAYTRSEIEKWKKVIAAAAIPPN